MVLLLFPMNAQQDHTLEEWVMVLEFQVENLNVDVTLLNNGLTDVGDEIDVIDSEIAALLSDQVIQDERILDLETTDESRHLWEGDITQFVHFGIRLRRKVTESRLGHPKRQKILDSAKIRHLVIEHFQFLFTFYGTFDNNIEHVSSN